MTRRPHLIGVDDGPFAKGQAGPVPIVAVMMEGPDLVEGIAITDFPVDGPDATGFLAKWLDGLRLRPAADALVLGGITLAGLGLVDVAALSQALGLPVVSVTRKEPRNERLAAALEAAGLAERIPLLERAPAAFEAAPGVWIAAAGAERESAARLLRASAGKAKLPEPLRVAHLVAAACASGESRGRP